jgi:hypothetical protein
MNTPNTPQQKLNHIALAQWIKDSQDNLDIRLELLAAIAAEMKAKYDALDRRIHAETSPRTVQGEGDMTFVIQAWILVTGAASIWLLSTSTGPRHHAGCWIGLAGQPAWIFTTLQHFQWGVFLLSVAFSISYLRGIRQHCRNHSQRR